MRIALMADIHANREAFQACLAHARAQGAERHVFLGDYVGYGADPVWTVDTVMDEVARGAVAVLGNHDHAVADARESMNPDAQLAIAWTRGQLGPAARAFLAGLPLAVQDGPRLYVHADVVTPRRWPYVSDAAAAARTLAASPAQATFCGHVHVPALYGISATHKLLSFRPVAGVAVPVPRHRRWLAVLGSVGQPRDGIAAASYALLDTARAEITFLRVPYDVEAAAAKIRAAGLPAALAARLGRGR
jgi:diadenosine tetraphosphatase ApaH/serine/threonine PP2A family protein phosphatase